MATVVKVPKTLGACADRLYTIKEEMAALNRTLEVFDTERKAIKEHLINNLPKNDAGGVSGKLCRVTITSKDRASVKDWAAFYKYILKKKDFSFLHRKVSDATVRDHWQAGEKIPGVEPFTAIDISINKL